MNSMCDNHDDNQVSDEKQDDGLYQSFADLGPIARGEWDRESNDMGYFSDLDDLDEDGNIPAPDADGNAGDGDDELPVEQSDGGSMSGPDHLSEDEDNLGSGAGDSGYGRLADGEDGNIDDTLERSDGGMGAHDSVTETDLPAGGVDSGYGSMIDEESSDDDE